MQVATLTRSLGEMQANWQIQEMQLELIALTAKMSARDINVARLFLEGHSLSECGALSKIPGTDAQDLSIKVGFILRKPDVKQYLALAKQMVTAQLMQRVSYDKAQWLEDMLLVLKKSTGEEQVNVVTHFEGTANSDKVFKDDLAAAKATLELIGKSQGWLTETKNLNVSAVEKVRVKDYTHDAPGSTRDGIEAFMEDDEKAARTRPQLAPTDRDQLVTVMIEEFDDDEDKPDWE